MTQAWTGCQGTVCKLSVRDCVTHANFGNLLRLYLGRGGYLTKSPGMILFWCKLYYFHITRLLAELGVKWTPLVAWVGAQPLFLAYFGINSTRMPSSRPNNRTSFYPQNTINILLLCRKLIMDVETEVWRGSDFDPFWHPFCCFFLRLRSHTKISLFSLGSEKNICVWPRVFCGHTRFSWAKKFPLLKWKTF